MGGMFGESKFEVMRTVPEHVKPKTILIPYPSTTDEILDQLAQHRMAFPVIFKPDLGERGWRVKKIQTRDNIDAYVRMINMPFLAQDFVSLPLEFGVFFIRYPGEPKGKVTSIVGKEMLSVCGDGTRTLRELILAKDRARLQWEALQHTFQHRLEEIIPKGERIELVSIGNHCLGTRFLNANHLITDQLSDNFDAISKSIPGFNFGRFDLRTASLADLERGQVMIMELNGCGAEPAHIYQPGFPLMEASRVLFRHWSDIYRVSSENHRRGTPYISFREAYAIYRRFKSLTAA